MNGRTDVESVENRGLFQKRKNAPLPTPTLLIPSTIRVRTLSGGIFTKVPIGKTP